MGCVSSSLLNQDEDLSQIGSAALGHHIVSLTSTTYGLLTLDPPAYQSRSTSTSTSTSMAATPTPTPTGSTTTTTAPTRFTLGMGMGMGSLFSSPLSLSESRAIRSEPEVINSWELMAGLDSNDSFRFSPLPFSTSSTCTSKPSTPKFFKPKLLLQAHPEDKENCHPNRRMILKPQEQEQGKAQAQAQAQATAQGQEAVKFNKYSLDEFPKVCPPNGEDRVVLYTTTLRGVRSTFEACNAVRSAIQALGYSFCERDISMDRGFRDELTHLLQQVVEHNQLEVQLELKSSCHSRRTSCSPAPAPAPAPPQLFVKGRYVGGAQEVLRIHDEGGLADLLQGQDLPRLKPGFLCDGCGGFNFLPCFRCHGSCKLVLLLHPPDSTTFTQQQSATTTTVVMRCPDCNENGLVLCPICT